MNFLLQNFVDGLKNYSLSLEKTSILINKPWALIDSDNEIQKLIFKKNKELIISKNGQVVEGSWEYFPEAKSLLINRGKDKLLCNEGFIDEGVMILKLDGTKNNFFVLANANIVPNLDANEYLKRLRRQKLNITLKTLSDGRTLEIYNAYDEANNYIDGNAVTIDAAKVDDGKYAIENSSYRYLVKDSIIKTIYFEYTYKTKSGLEILVEQHSESYKKGDKVWLNGKQAPDGEYKIIHGRDIIIKNGVIIKKKLF